MVVGFTTSYMQSVTINVASSNAAHGEEYSINHCDKSLSVTD